MAMTTEAPLEYPRYALVNRPAGLGTVPSGLRYRIEPRPSQGQPHHEMARHGILVPERGLTRQELQSFELAMLVDGPVLSVLAERICADGMAEYAAEYLRLKEDDPGSLEQYLAERVQRLDVGVAYSIGGVDELAEQVAAGLRSHRERYGEVRERA